jgi:excisionase family DNA binding protein
MRKGAPREWKGADLYPARIADRGAALVRLALSKQEAAAALGVSVDYFEDHVQPELRIVRRGRRRLIQIAELERWLERSAALAVGNGS